LKPGPLRPEPSALPKARNVRDAARVAGRLHDLSVGTVVGTIGGVRPSGYRGGLDLDGGSWSRGWTCGPRTFGSWCWWSPAWCWSWYYPCWWWYWRPTYVSEVCYYPVFSVVYSQPLASTEVVTVAAAPEPVGEAVAYAPAAPAAPALAGGLSIAAQRYLELGDRAFREGRYTDAVQAYAKAVEFAPEEAALHLVLSDALFAAGDYHYAAYSVRRALDLDPSLVASRVDKHGFYPDPQQFDAQLATLERYGHEHPSDRDARLVLALNYLFGGRPADAVRVLESGTAPDEPAARAVLDQARAVVREAR
jgi:hypothetical protein